MRGAFLVVILITLLIVGLLVAKNMTSEVNDETQKIESIQKAKETAREVEDKTRELKDRAKQAMQDMENSR